MQSAVITGPRTMELREVEAPRPVVGEVLVRVRACGICGTDLHFYRGEFPAAPGMQLGHEAAGEVEAVGDGVAGFAPGDRVALELIVVCLRCEMCRAGQYHLCPNRKFGGIQLPGGLREQMAVPSSCLYKLPEEVDFELGALCEPLAVGVHGLKIAGLQFGERVAVLGAGTIGLLAAAAAKAMGAGRIAITARHPQQKAMAEVFGIDAVYDATGDGIRAMGRDLGGADIAVETVGGHGETLQQAMNLVAAAGRVSVLGLFTKPVELNLTGFLLKEGRMIGSATYGRSGTQSDYDLAIEIMRREGETLRKMITHRYALASVGDAFRVAEDKGSGSIKVQIAL